MKEIRYRVFYIFLSFFITFVCIWIKITPILYAAMKPLGSYANELIFTDLPEFWYSLFLLSISFCFFMLFPSIVYNLWSFLTPSLYEYERKHFFLFFFLSSFLYLVGNFLVYQKILPFLVQFFLDSQIKSALFHVNYLAKVFSYMHFLTSTFLISFFLFQIPVIFFFLCELKMLSVAFMIKNRIYFLFLIVILASLLSPPDILSQCFLSLFLFFIYECCIYYCLCIFLKTNR
jgi:sec-independent protein translocase protein TatC